MDEEGEFKIKNVKLKMEGGRTGELIGRIIGGRIMSIAVLLYHSALNCSAIPMGSENRKRKSPGEPGL